MSLRSPPSSRVALCVFATAMSTMATSCIRHPGFRANSGATILLAGEVLVWPDSIAAAGAQVAVLGGPTPAKLGMLAGTIAGRDGRFAVQLGSSTQIDCTTLRVQVRKLGHVSLESRPGQLLCTSTCQWVDVRIRRAGMADEIDLIDLTPNSCDWPLGYPEPKRPA